MTAASHTHIIPSSTLMLCNIPPEINVHALTVITATCNTAICTLLSKKEHTSCRQMHMLKLLMVQHVAIYRHAFVSFDNKDLCTQTSSLGAASKFSTATATT